MPIQTQSTVPPRILIVDDDQTIHLALKYLLKKEYRCLSAFNGDEALAVLSSQTVDIVLMDLHMRRQFEGLEYLPKILASQPNLEALILSGDTEPNLAARCAEAGAAGYILKGSSEDQILMTVQLLIHKRSLQQQTRAFTADRKQNLEKHQIIGNSQPIRNLMAKVEKLKNANVHVLISGESGTGKELVARHIAGKDSKPLITVDSSTITSSMAESILFGHEKGAFTGAASQTPGLFEEANGGSIFFDEVANMPLDIQSKLLRVIQEKEILRVGSTRVIPLEFRVMAATNRNLDELCAKGLFKFDLFQRLNVVEVRIPSLRERPEDIPLLAEHFLRKFARPGSPTHLSRDAHESLMRYSWPGNVRELSNVLAGICAIGASGEEGAEILAADLPPKFHQTRLPSALSPSPEAQTFGKDSVRSAPTEEITSVGFYSEVQRLEGKLLHDYYQKLGGNLSKMSRVLGMSRTHLYSKLREHQLKR
jgi:DNA-binding NtrC family response regulator